jgi:BRCT domain type II-containing protein
MIDGAVDYSVYRQLMPLYFPRTDAEHAEAVARLPLDCGDEWGETMVEERKIRIGITPTENGTNTTNNNSSSTTSSTSTSSSSSSSSTRNTSFANESTIISDEELQPRALATMLAPTDSIRQQV